MRRDPLSTYLKISAPVSLLAAVVTSALDLPYAAFCFACSALIKTLFLRHRAKTLQQDASVEGKP